MLRDRALVPLSHQHQHALALCVRIERALQAGATNADTWQVEIDRGCEQEIKFHFAAEEQVLFPSARRFSQLMPLVDELIQEHGQLRKHFAQAKKRAMDSRELGKFAKLLSQHIRKEEKQLFEAMQKLLSPQDLTAVGKELEGVLQATARACRIPGESGG